MARGHGIFVVLGLHAPLKAFTIKYELKHWLRERWKENPLAPPVTVHRLPDGECSGKTYFVFITGLTLERIEEF